jgi:hypothetical protein
MHAAVGRGHYFFGLFTCGWPADRPKSWIPPINAEVYEPMTCTALRLSSSYQPEEREDFGAY